MSLELLYKCDGVGCSSETNAPVFYKWNVLQRLNTEYDESTLHFCAIECLIDFFKRPDWKAE